MSAAAVEEFAPAKVNLALHVTGRRPDGYHELDSLVVFASLGDRLKAMPGEGLTLTLTGPRASGLPVAGNLVLKAAIALAEAAGRPHLGARLVLDKQLPAAAGLGGGSADAAAALRALNRLWALELPPAELMHLGLRIGADVPVCVASVSARVRGIGEVVTPLAGLPGLHLVVANSGRGLATGEVFGRLKRPDQPGLAEPLGPFDGVEPLLAYLEGCRNDLEPPALAAAPEIADLLAALSDEKGCLLARMSGSGATCFGIYATPELALAAARRLAARRGEWWVAAAQTL